jgi:hypothetical protein
VNGRGSHPQDAGSVAAHLSAKPGIPDARAAIDAWPRALYLLLSLAPRRAGAAVLQRAMGWGGAARDFAARPRWVAGEVSIRRACDDRGPRNHAPWGRTAV